MIKQHDLTTGDITRGIWSFAVPLMLGNVMQQLYNLVDTWVVGTYLGNGALAAFAVAVKIDTTAYMPVQDFGNASSVLWHRILVPGTRNGSVSVSGKRF